MDFALILRVEVFILSYSTASVQLFEQFNSYLKTRREHSINDHEQVKHFHRKYGCLSKRSLEIYCIANI